MIVLSSKTEKTIIPTLLAIFIFAGVFYSFYGRVFLDAGFYLNASREVYRGHMPYRDFIFVQGPVYPYVYGLPLLLTGYKVIFARWLSLLFGILTLALATWTSGQTQGGFGKIVTLAALATVPYQAYFFSSVKLYALTGFLLMAGFACLASKLPLTIKHSCGLMMIVLAAATRLTLVPVAFIVVGYVIIDNYAQKRGIPWMALMVTTVTAIVLAGPFLVADHEAVLYNLIKIHISAAAGPYLFSFSKQLRVLAKLVIFYPILSIGASYILFQIIGKRAFRVLTRLDIAMFLSIASVTGVHLTANWFSMGYQSPIMPLTAVFVGSLTGRFMKDTKVSRPVLILTMLCVLTTWFISWEKPIWRNDLSAMRSLAFIGQVIKEHTPENGTIAACNAVFA
ncbi:hypothetical protein K8T06_15680, partial [bacterium]|nr:hypothetical protein [bacterium]